MTALIAVASYLVKAGLAFASPTTLRPLAGFADADAVILSRARSGAPGAGLPVAMSADIAAKATYAAKIGRRGFPLAYGAATTTAVGGGVLGLWLTAGFLWS